MALVLFEFGFEALEQGERVGGAAGEAGQDALVEQAAQLARALLDDDIAQRHLTVSTESDGLAAANGENGSAVKGIHGVG